MDVQDFADLAANLFQICFGGQGQFGTSHNTVIGLEAEKSTSQPVLAGGFMLSDAQTT